MIFRIVWLSISATVVLSLISILIDLRNIGYGIFAGGSVSILNFILIVYGVRIALNPIHSVFRMLLTFFFIFKFLILGIILYVFLAKLSASGLGIIIGISGVLSVIIVLGIASRSGYKKEGTVWRAAE